MPRVGGWTQHLRVLQDAQEQKCKVKIYAWSTTVSKRVIEPMRLVQIERGWEVDAGPVEPEDDVRTYLLSNVRSAEPCDETFEPPAGSTSLLVKQRKTTTVQMTITQDARWAGRQFAEHGDLVNEDKESVTLDLDMLPPVDERVAQIMLASGTSTKAKPGAVLPEALKYVEVLRQHHPWD